MIDAHYMPVNLGVAILERFKPYLHSETYTILDPCVGGEALTQAADIVFGECCTIGWDIDPGPAETTCDMRETLDCVPSLNAVTLCEVGDLLFINPPFTTKGKAFDVAHRVVKAVADHADRTGCQTLMLAPAAWLTSPEHRLGWLRDSSTSHLPIGGRIWSGVREMMVYGWNIPSAPYWLPELKWNKRMAEAGWIDSTCAKSRKATP